MSTALTPDVKEMLQVRMAGYRPPLTYRPSFNQLGLPPFTLATVEWMKRDPQVRLGMAIKAAPFHKSRLTIKADPEVSEFMSSTIRRFWQRGIPKVVRGFWYTLSGGEITYKENQSNHRYEFWSYNDIYPADLSILHTMDQGIPVGISIKNSNPGLNYSMPTQSSWAQPIPSPITPQHLYFPKGFLYIHNREFGSLVGRSELEAAYDSWLEKNDFQGAKHSRKLWFYKNAFGGGILLHPPGNYKTATGEEIPYYDIARQAMETSLNGAVWCLENKTDPAGNQLWQYIEPSVRQGGDKILEYVSHLDNEILRGMGIPDDVVQQVSGTGSYAGRSIPMMAFFISHEDVLDNLFNVCDEQVFRPICQANFGHADYEATMDVDIESIMGSMDGGAAGQMQPQMPVDQNGQPIQPAGALPQNGQPQQMGYDPHFIKQPDFPGDRKGIEIREMSNDIVPTTWDEVDPLCPGIRVTYVAPKCMTPIQMSRWEEAFHVRAGEGRVTQNRSGKTSTGGQFADKIGNEGPSVPKPGSTYPASSPGAAGRTGSGLSAASNDPSPAAHAQRRAKILATLSANPDTRNHPGMLEGLADLNVAAAAGDLTAGRLLSDIARDALNYLLGGITGAEVKYDAATGLYGGDLEASLGVSLEFNEADRPAVLAALAKFAENFNQHQVHARSGANPGERPGNVNADGSYNTVAYRIGLKQPMTREAVQDVINASGLYGLTSTEDYLEAYYVGPTNHIPSIVRFQQSVRVAANAIGANAGPVEFGTQKLWVYGHGDAIPYQSIAGNIRPGTPDYNPSARRVAERLARRPVVPSQQAKSEAPEQDALQTQIASLYEAMPMDALSDKHVRKAYEALAREVLDQYKALPVKIVAMGNDDDDPVEPYSNSAAMRTDVLSNNRLKIFKTRNETFGPPGVSFPDHPLLRDTGLKDASRTEKYPNGIPLNYNDLLRAVHDYYAHTLSPVEFGPRGEEAAWKNHMAMTVSPWARWALTSETRGQNSWVNFGPLREHNRSAATKKSSNTIFADQKVGLLPVEFAKTGDPKLDAEMDEVAVGYSPEWPRTAGPIQYRQPQQLGFDPSDIEYETEYCPDDVLPVLQLGHRHGQPVQFAVQHMQEAHELINPKTGKRIKGGQFTPRQGNPVSKPAAPARPAPAVQQAPVRRPAPAQVPVIRKPAILSGTAPGQAERTATPRPGVNPEAAKPTAKPVAPKPVQSAKPPARTSPPPIVYADSVRDLEIATRVPGSSKFSGDAHDPNNLVGLEVVKNNPGYLKKLSDKLSQQVPARALGSPPIRLESIKQHMKENLKWLYDQVPENVRQRTKLWYDGANRLANHLAQKFNVTEAQACGVIAALSPQKDWFENASCAERVMDAFVNRQGFRWDNKMDKTADRLLAVAQNNIDIRVRQNTGKGIESDTERLQSNYENLVSKVDQVRGLTLGEIKAADPAEQELLEAIWVRFYDESHNPKYFRDVLPEGVLGDTATTSTGMKRKLCWGGYDPIAKALRIMKATDIRQISETISSAHKVRNFFNNIYSPNSGRQHVTIDTHAVAAALLMPLSGDSAEVKTNFSKPGDSMSGTYGAYPVYATAYRELASELGIKARELQSITWEAIRGLFPEDMKKGGNKSLKPIRELWKQVKKGTLHADVARERILGISTARNPEPFTPRWFESSPEQFENVHQTTFSAGL